MSNIKSILGNIFSSSTDDIYQDYVDDMLTEMQNPDYKIESVVSEIDSIGLKKVIDYIGIEKIENIIRKKKFKKLLNG